MLSIWKSRMRTVIGVLLFSAAVITAPVNAQTGEDVIFNEILNNDILQMPDPKGAFVSSANFTQRYAATIKRVNGQKSITIRNGEVPAVKPAPEPVYNDSREEWHFVLSGSQTENSDQIFIQPARAVIVNHNKWLHYVFLSQDILPVVYDRVNEKLAKRQKELIEQFDDVKMTISRHGNKMVVDAIYDYINDEKDIKAFTDFGRAIARESDLEERMRVLMRESVDLISAIRFEAKRAEKDARNDLENQALSYLDRSTFVFLINDGYENFDVIDGPKEGRWDFTGGETEAYYEIYNFGLLQHTTESIHTHHTSGWHLRSICNQLISGTTTDL
jgi:hypothetical protein